MYIIADVGSNWTTKKDCLDSIYYASKTGANAVKFQLFDHKALYGYPCGMKEALPREWIPELYEKAKTHKIDFMVTPFNPDDIAFIDPFVKCWKIASSDINYVALLKKVATTTKPVVLSTGASTEDDIEKALNLLNKNCEVVLMYCVSSYPSVEHDLSFVKYLKERFDSYSVGYSDHSADIYQSAYCAKYHYGCSVYEKHFKINEMDTPDNDHSLDWHEFKRMVDRLKTDGPLKKWKTNYSENDMTQLHNRRLVATRDIDRDEILEYGYNFGAYRTKIRGPQRISPWDWQKIQGKPAKNAISQGKSITLNDI